jgi:hypothetical protein
MLADGGCMAELPEAFNAAMQAKVKVTEVMQRL